MTDRIRPFLLTQVWVLSLLLALFWKPVKSDIHLRKRVANEDVNNEEFGRTLKLFRDENHPHDTKQQIVKANKTQRLPVFHHVVDAKHEEEMSSIEEDMIASAFESRMLDFISLSMSMPYVPTPAPTEPPVMIRLPPPVPSPVYVATYGPTVEPTVALTSRPTEYLETTQTYTPTKAPTSLPTEIPTTSSTNYNAQTPSPIVPQAPYPTEAPTQSPSYYVPQSTSPTQAPTPAPTEPYSDAATYVPASSQLAENDSVKVLSLQQQAGVCSGPSNGVGCASESDEMQGGNPNDIVNCFSVAGVDLSPPFQLAAVRFWLGDSTVPPADLSIQVWAGTVGSGPTTKNLHSQTLDGYVSGENIVRLDEALLLFDAEFCVGVKSSSIEDGLRIQTDGGQSDQASYLMSPDAVCQNSNLWGISLVLVIFAVKPW
jgi:hypothetical protein